MMQVKSQRFYTTVESFRQLQAKITYNKLFLKEIEPKIFKNGQKITKTWVNQEPKSENFVFSLFECYEGMVIVCNLLIDCNIGQEVTIFKQLNY